MGRDAKAFEIKHEIGDAIPAGAYYFTYRHDAEPRTPIGIIHGCPCGCGIGSGIFFKGLGLDGHDEWSVEGEWPNVTLKPSIGIGKQSGGGYHWHGYLENGVFVEK